MMRNLTLLLVLIFAIACKKQDGIQIKFLDEFIVQDSLMVDSTLVGGLSGIDYSDGVYYVVSDDSKHPRFYKINIEIDLNRFSKIDFEKAILLRDTLNYYDPESILFEDGQILITSEGLIREGKDPAFFVASLQGDILDRFQIPNYFKAKSPQEPRNNGMFEGLSRSYDNKGYWIITELPLESDGIAPTASEADSPVRLTYYDKSSKKAQQQFAYELDKIAKAPLGKFAVNGVTDLLAYAPDKLWVVERSFSSGHGNMGNDIKIYEIDTSKATNTMNITSLKDVNYTPVTKKLIFDFESIRAQLTNHTIDNVEGICFGPTLTNGNQSLLFIVDNDFNRQGNRLSQIILMEVSKF